MSTVVSSLYNHMAERSRCISQPLISLWLITAVFSTRIVSPSPQLLSPLSSTHKTSSKFLPGTKNGTSSALGYILAAMQILRGHLPVPTLSLLTECSCPITFKWASSHLSHHKTSQKVLQENQITCSVCLLRLRDSLFPLHIHRSTAQSAMKRFPLQSLHSTPEAYKLLKTRHSTFTTSLLIRIAYNLIHWGKNKTPRDQKAVSYSNPAMSSPQCYLHLAFHKIFLLSSDCWLEDQHKHHEKQQNQFYSKCWWMHKILWDFLLIALSDSNL